MPFNKTPVRKPANKTSNDYRYHPTVIEIHNRLDDHETRLTAMEGLAETLESIDETVSKVFRYIKFAAPSIIAAAISAGLVNGKLGAFLNALLTGSP